MSQWILLWKIMFVVVMCLFAAMACLVAFYGARDIRRLLRGLKDESDVSRNDEENHAD